MFFVVGFVFYITFYYNNCIKVLHNCKTSLSLNQQQKITDMKFLHFLEDQNEETKEQHYTNSDKPSYSMKITRDIKNYTYKIWSRETNEIIIVK